MRRKHMPGCTCCGCSCPDYPAGPLGLQLSWSDGIVAPVSIPFVAGVNSYSGTAKIAGAYSEFTEQELQFAVRHNLLTTCDGYTNLIVNSGLNYFDWWQYFEAQEYYKFAWNATINPTACTLTFSAELLHVIEYRQGKNHRNVYAKTQYMSYGATLGCTPPDPSPNFECAVTCDHSLDVSALTAPASSSCGCRSFGPILGPFTEDYRGTSRENHNLSSFQTHYLNSAAIGTTVLDLCDLDGASSSTPVFTANDFAEGFFSSGNPGDSSMIDPVYVANCLDPVDGIGTGCGTTAYESPLYTKPTQGTLSAQFYYE